MLGGINKIITEEDLNQSEDKNDKKNLEHILKDLNE